jgi:hypothetical protein
MSQFSTTEERAMQMLGTGTPTVIVASTLGVTESRISQLLADEVFAAQVQELRFANLQKQTKLDERYSDTEDLLLDKLTKVLPLLTRPRDIIAAISTINGTKRRGATTTGGDTQQSRVVNLTIPVMIAHKFVSNVNNQVVEVHNEHGEARSLVTATSGSLDRISREVLQGNNNEPPKAIVERYDPEVIQARLRQGGAGEASNSGPITVEDLL